MRLTAFELPTPGPVFDLEQSTKAQIESRHAADQVLRDRHCDQHDDSEIVIRDFAYRRFSVALFVHESGEVVCPLSISGLECKSTSRAMAKMSPILSFFRRRSVSARAVWVSSSNIVIEAGYLDA